MGLKLRAAVLALGFLAPVIGASAPAFAENYKCSVSELGTETDYIATETSFSISSDGTEVQVVDDLIERFLGGPITVKVIENTDKRVVFRWNIDMTNQGIQTTRMAYRATLLREKGTLRVFANPSGYDNDFEGRGPCKKQ